MGRGSWRCCYGILHGLLLPVAAERPSSTGFGIDQIPHFSRASPPLDKQFSETQWRQLQKAHRAPASSEPAAGGGFMPPIPVRPPPGTSACGRARSTHTTTTSRLEKPARTQGYVPAKTESVNGLGGLQGLKAGAEVECQLKQQHGKKAEAAEYTARLAGKDEGSPQTFHSQSAELFFLILAEMPGASSATGCHLSAGTDPTGTGWCHRCRCC